MNRKKLFTGVLAVFMAGSLCLTSVAAADFTDAADTVAVEDVLMAENEMPVVEEAEVSKEAEVFTAGEDAVSEEADEEFSSLSYEVYVDGGTCGKNATWSISESGVLRVSGTGSVSYVCNSRVPITKLVVDEGITYFNWNNSSLLNITSVSLPSTLTEIGVYTFTYCKKLTSITIPNNVTRINEGVFDGCSGLKSVKIGKKVEYIGNHAFRDCSAITEIELPDTVTFMGTDVFRSCTSLRKANFPKKMTKIPYNCFQNCKSLERVTIGSNIKEICGGAYRNCTGLAEVVIPDTVTSLGGSGDYVFEGCTGIKKIIIGTGITKLHGNTFRNCTSLKEVYFRGTAPSFFNNVFENVSADVYRPQGDKTWQPYNMINHGEGRLYWKTWVPDPVMGSVTNTASGPKVTWNAVAGAAGYIVFRSTNGGAFERVKKTSSLSWTDTKAKTNGAKYSYYVVGYSGSAKSTASLTKYTYYLTKPAAPSLSNTSSKKLNISWKKNSKATGYQLQYATNSKFTGAKTVTISSVSTLKKTLTNLTKGKKYYVRTRALKNVLGAKYYSTWGSAKSITITR